MNKEVVKVIVSEMILTNQLSHELIQEGHLDLDRACSNFIETFNHDGEITFSVAEVQEWVADTVKDAIGNYMVKSDYYNVTFDDNNELIFSLTDKGRKAAEELNG